MLLSMTVNFRLNVHLHHFTPRVIGHFPPLLPNQVEPLPRGPDLLREAGPFEGGITVEREPACSFSLWIEAGTVAAGCGECITLKVRVDELLHIRLCRARLRDFRRGLGGGGLIRLVRREQVFIERVHDDVSVSFFTGRRRALFALTDGPEGAHPSIGPNGLT